MSRYHAAHDATSGPGDARPTAMQVVQDEGLLNALPDKTVLVTGTSSGIGIPTVEALAATGATVFCTARNLAKGRDALAHVLKPGKVELIEMDNESLGSVRRGADEFLRRSGGKLNVLVANAGIMACPEAKSGDGHELQFATNHLAHFLLFQTVKDSLLRCSTGEFNSRVVLLSSMGHKSREPKYGDYAFSDGSYTPWGAYGQAKSANIYMANQIERLYGAQGLHALSLHPGGITSGLQKHISDDTKAKWAENPEVNNYMKSPEQGAATTMVAALAKEWEGKGGKYLEDCEEAVPEERSRPALGGKKVIGYAAHAYNPAGEERLWKDSFGLVGLPTPA